MEKTEELAQLNHGFEFSLADGKHLEIRKTSGGESTVLWKSDEHLLRVGYGAVDPANLMLRGNINKYP